MLEASLPVRFVGFEAGSDDYDAVVALPGAPTLPDGLPSLVALCDLDPTAPMPGLGEPEPAHGAMVHLSSSAPLDRRLRGLRLRDESLDNVAAVPADGAVVLATRGRDAVWVARGDCQVVAIAPAELQPGESLRARMRNGRFLALMALVHFARSVCASGGWTPPPLRASFLFDDPNLHRPTYGHVRYRDFVAHADRHDYHVAFATIPLDAWFAHGETARLFRERGDRLSFVVHGNDHTHRELAQPSTARERHALLAQAIRRIEAFERRSGVPVGRVMVPPHGACSREMALELIALGFEALCISRPYPWLARPPHPWLARPLGSSPLVGWEPASVIENGLPVLLRRAFSEPDEDLALRAFLDQPLILYGHHADVAGGLDRLAELAELIRGFGDVRWMPLTDIAASNVATRIDGDALRVRMFTRRARLTVPDGVERLIVHAPALEAITSHDVVDAGPGIVAECGDPIVLNGHSRDLEIRLVRDGALAPHAVPAPGLRYWPVARRLMGESRDRLLPLYRRVRRPLT